MKRIAFILALFTSIQAAALWDYNQNNAENMGKFRLTPIFSEAIDPDNIDYRRLNAAVFFVTNE